LAVSVTEVPSQIQESSGGATISGGDKRTSDTYAPAEHPYTSVTPKSSSPETAGTVLIVAVDPVTSPVQLYTKGAVPPVTTAVKLAVMPVQMVSDVAMLVDIPGCTQTKVELEVEHTPFEYVTVYVKSLEGATRILAVVSPVFQ